MLDKPFYPNQAIELQNENRNWWRRHPMSYDWRSTIVAAEGTREFFEEIDRRFFGASPFFHGNPPFADLIPYESLRGKRVLEIGCGLGSHSELLAEAGCKLTAIDLTARAVELTSRRLILKDLATDVREMDAERMEFASREFDFVWSWGVIHHSAQTNQIVREVARVLKPGGEFRFMVYNRRSFDACTKLARGQLTGKALRGMSRADILSYYTDGFLARFYDREQLRARIEENGLTSKSIAVLGQTSELIPLPGRGAFGRIKDSLLQRVPDWLAKAALRRVGSFLFAIAEKH